MRALLVIDMQRWMFRTPDRAAQLPVLLQAIERLSLDFEARNQPLFDIRTEHKADRSTWSRLMLRYDYPCLLEGSEDTDTVDGLVPRGTRITKTANDAFLGTDLETELHRQGVSEIVLAGVFMDGCVGLTAAAAAQRGFAVCFADRAIGVRDQTQAIAIRSWLIEMYELSTC
ncbi:cysteine hydrolase family protein [Lacibacterium aquatile]|uniref:Cysteine hydrolase family protein n=1 Tax=Lacibacterium aquatile TaxID=1168082 RepID=A0ABW5DN57_9PROT